MAKVAVAYASSDLYSMLAGVARFNEIYYLCYKELSAKQSLFMYDSNEKHYHSEEIESAKGNELILDYVNLLGLPWERVGRENVLIAHL